MWVKLKPFGPCFYASALSSVAHGNDLVISWLKTHLLGWEGCGNWGCVYADEVAQCDFGSCSFWHEITLMFLSVKTTCQWQRKGLKSTQENTNTASENMLWLVVNNPGSNSRCRRLPLYVPLACYLKTHIHTVTDGSKPPRTLAHVDRRSWGTSRQPSK